MPDTSCNNQDKPEWEQGLLMKRCSCRSTRVATKDEAGGRLVVISEKAQYQGNCKGAILDDTDYYIYKFLSGYTT